MAGLATKLQGVGGGAWGWEGACVLHMGLDRHPSAENGVCIIKACRGSCAAWISCIGTQVQQQHHTANLVSTPDHLLHIGSTPSCIRAESLAANDPFTINPTPLPCLTCVAALQHCHRLLQHVAADRAPQHLCQWRAGPVLYVLLIQAGARLGVPPLRLAGRGWGRGERWRGGGPLGGGGGGHGVLGGPAAALEGLG